MQRTAGAIANVFADAALKAKAAAAGPEAELRDRYLTGLMERLEGELAPTMAKVFARILDDDDAPPEIRAIAERAADPGHQSDLILQMVASIGVIFGGFTVLSQPLMQQYVNRLNANFADVPLSADQAATLANRRVWDYDRARTEARQSGVDDGRFAALVDLAETHPALGELLTLWRRGQIDERQVRDGLRLVGIDDRWADELVSLRVNPPTVPDVLAMVTSSWMTPEVGRRLVEVNGLDPGYFDAMLETAGRPPSPEQLYELLNRGVIGDEDFRRAYLESNIKNKYVDLMLQLRFRVPPMERIIAMLRRGSIDEKAAANYLHQLGFFPVDIERMIGEATADKMAPERDLAKGEILALYDAKAVSRDQALSWIVDLGYSAGEAEMIVTLLDAQRIRRAQNAAIGAVRARYVAHKIRRPEASTQLDALGVTVDMRDDLLGFWDLEAEINVQLPTKAELTKGWRVGLLDDDELLAKLAERGFREDDAEFILALLKEGQEAET